MSKFYTRWKRPLIRTKVFSGLAKYPKYFTDWYKYSTLKNVQGPEGVRGRNSDNCLIYEKIGWKPSRPLKEGIYKTYIWIKEQVDNFSSSELLQKSS